MTVLSDGIYTPAVLIIDICRSVSVMDLTGMGTHVYSSVC